MSEFSNLLSELIRSEEIHVADLTRYCGLDRSTMYKLINGKRSPGSLETVQKIADYVQLSPWERRKLLEAYEITRLGSEIFYQRRDILKFILNIQDLQKPSLPAGEPQDALPAPSGNALPLTGRIQVSAAIHGIFRRASAASAGEIQILAQPVHLKVLNLVAALVSAGKNLRIRHIICLNNKKATLPLNYNYNLQSLSDIVPFYGTSCQYYPYYYYDSLESHFGSFDLLSCGFLTENEAVICSAGLENGYYLRTEEMIAPLKRHFRKLFSMAHPLVLSFESSLEFHFRKYPELAEGVKESYSLSYEPSLGICLHPDLVDKYLAKDLEHREDFLAQARSYFRASGWTHNYFSPAGLRSFLETGRVNEIPAELYHPLEYPERVRLLKKYIHLLDTGLDIRMYRDSLSEFPANFHMRAAGSFGYLMFISQENHYSYLILEEPNLLNAFLDFASSLAETELLATAEETREFLLNTLETYGG